MRHSCSTLSGCLRCLTPVPANCLSSPPPSAGCGLPKKNLQNRGVETELGEPVSKRSWANQYQKRGWANQYRNGVGRTSIKNGVGRASIERRLGGPVSSPSGLGEPSPSRWVSKTQQKGPLSLLAFFLALSDCAKKTGKNFHILSTPAPVQPAEGWDS